MKSAKILLFVLPLIIGVTLSCKFLDKETSSKPLGNSPTTKGPDPAEMDCKQAEQAYRELLASNKTAEAEPAIAEYRSKLEKKLSECKGTGKGTTAYRVDGESNNVSFKGEICSIEKPFSIDATFPGGTATTTFSPSGAAEGTTTVGGGGNGCKHSGGGDYTVGLGDDGAATLKWTTSDKITCPGFSNSRTATFSLPLKPAPDLKCP